MRVLFVLLFFLLPHLLFAQIGGRRSLDFLNAPTFGRELALGGVHLTPSADEAAGFVMNPALLLPEHDLQFSLGYQSRLAGSLNQTALALPFEHKKLGSFGLQLQYLSYGEMPETDATGQTLGTFRGSAYSVGITHARRKGPYHLGATLKIAGEQLETYNASGLFLDLGGAFVHPDRDFRMGFVFQNLGVLLSNYFPDADYTAPIDVRMGLSYKPEKMPLRLSLSAQNLFWRKTTYYDPALNTTLDPTGNPVFEELGGLAKAARHLVFGTEFVMSKNFNLRAGYNVLRRSELVVDNRPALTGFSFGVMVRLKNFEFNFTRSQEHLAGGTNLFGFRLNTQQLLRKSRVVE